MSRIAYIISAYKDAPHLLRLINALDKDADFYVHVDKKINIEPFYALLKNRVTFVPRHWISWGGWEQVEYQKELLGAAINSGKEYSHIVCLSGQDYPLWNNEKIHSFFKNNHNKEYISGYNLTKCKNKQQRSKFINYHFFRNLECNNLWLKNKMIVLARNLMSIIPIKKKDTILIQGKECDIYFGSDYWAITLSCAKYVYQILTTEKSLKQYFYHSFAPSELCIHTIIFNSHFAPKAIKHEGEYPGLFHLTPLHYIDYKKSVKSLTENDFTILQKSEKMFCRKIVSGMSDKLISLISIHG